MTASHVSMHMNESSVSYSSSACVDVCLCLTSAVSNSTYMYLVASCGLAGTPYIMYGFEFYLPTCTCRYWTGNACISRRLAMKWYECPKKLRLAVHKIAIITSYSLGATNALSSTGIICSRIPKRARGANEMSHRERFSRKSHCCLVAVPGYHI